jgi:hypothetical protein
MKVFLSTLLVRVAIVLPALAIPFFSLGQTVQQEKKDFVATVTSFQTSFGYQANKRLIWAVVHFRNKTDKPLILALNREGTGGSDEQGNRYGVANAYGIGSVSQSDLDAKFALPEGGSGDALILLQWQGGGIYGVTFDLHVAVKELTHVKGAEYEIGPESTLGFTDLKTGLTFSLENAPEISKHLVDAGPFTARITRYKFGKGSYSYPIASDFTVEVENKSDKPIVLAIEADSIFGSDDEGNMYGGNGSAGYGKATGIGQTNRERADPQFVLAPGEVKEFQLAIGRGRARSLGSSFTLNFQLEKLEVLPSKQILEVRQYSLTFPKIRM